MRFDPNIPLSDLIRQTRVGKLLTCEYVAQKTGVTKEYISKIESGDITPDENFLKRISGTLGIPYPRLRVSAGFNMLKNYPSYYTSSGKEVPIEEILDRIYFKDPGIMPFLYEKVFNSFEDDEEDL